MKNIDIVKIGQEFIYKNSRPEYAGKSISQLKELGLTPNDVFVQGGFSFPTPPNVIFINENLELVKNFSDLPAFKLNSEDQKKVNESYKKNLLAQFDKITLRTELEAFISYDMQEFYLEDEDQTVKDIKSYLTEIKQGTLYSDLRTKKGFLYSTILQGGKVVPLFEELKSIQAKLPNEEYPAEFVECVRNLKYKILSFDVDFPKEKFVAEMDTINKVFRDKILTLPSNVQEKLSKNGIGRFYNGEHLAVENILYNQMENTLYVKAASTDYVTLAANANVFLSQGYVRIGVITPFITSDEKLYLFERNDAYKLWSAVSGFIQPINGSVEDLVNRTAEAESNEELFWNINKKPVITGQIFANHLSYRALHSSPDKPSAQIPTYEFIAPQFLPCTQAELDKIIDTSVAPDVKDHTGKRNIVSLNSINSILENYFSDRPGNFLYRPIIISAIQEHNKGIFQNEWLSELKIEELADKLMNYNPDKYRLTPDTPYLDKIVFYILQTKDLQTQQRVLNPAVLKAAIEKDEELLKTILSVANPSFKETIEKGGFSATALIGEEAELLSDKTLNRAKNILSLIHNVKTLKEKAPVSDDEIISETINCNKPIVSEILELQNIWGDYSINVANQKNITMI